MSTYFDRVNTMMNQCGPPSWKYLFVSNLEIENAVFSLRKKSAAGEDGIGIELIQVAYGILEPYLSKLFNTCLDICHYPLGWKIAKITVLKKPNRETYKTPKSFRPISVLNTLGKIYEKILYERLNWLSKENNWFTDNQQYYTILLCTKQS